MHHRRMKQHTNSSYAGYRYRAEIISHTVCLYFRFTLSLRDVEELLATRRIIVTYQTVRQGCLKFGQDSANEVRRRQPRRGDKWHLDEVFITIDVKRHYLWRAVDQDGYVLDILVQSRRHKRAAKPVLPQVAQGPALCAAGHRDGQASKLWCGP
jgi:putative transposase